MKISYQKIIVIVFIIGLLQGCGFRLRGASELPPTIKYAVIDGVGQYSDAGQAIKQQIEASGAKVLTKADVDTVHFVVLRNNFFRRVLSVDASGIANEYELSYEFSMRMLDAKGKPIVSERPISLNRNYQYDPNNALANSNEEAGIKLQMVSLAVRQAMRRIGIKLRKISKFKPSDDSSQKESKVSNPVTPQADALQDNKK
ncbi:hypothetical protein JYT31_02255 [Beggiatoa alba]|nr:hypothetical protein [Beggiatoa alba]